jgi:CRISPR-associated protein Cmr3
MLLEIEALDTLFFRDGKAFAAGEDVWADSTGLPTPAGIYGALRAAYAVRHGIAPEDIEVRTKSLKIAGLHYAVPGKPCLMPAPLDLGVDEDGKDREAHFAKCVPLPGVVSNFTLPKILEFPRVDGKTLTVAEHRLLAENPLKRYLKGEARNLKVDDLRDYVCAEPKIGIARNNATHSAEEGRLYRVEMRRFATFRKNKETKNYKEHHLKLVVEISGLKNFPESGLLKLGGEAKAARFTQADEDDAVTWNAPNLDGQQFFKLYLATPAIFKGGTFPTLPPEVDATLIATATAKPLAIGGFDIRKGKPKPMYQAVPAGSVYYYQSNTAPQTIIEKLHRRSISAVYSEQGFGLALIASLQEQNP